jgi:tetratricopeptide (TPR) repeat protein
MRAGRKWLILIPLVLVKAETVDVLADPAFQHFYNLEYDQALAIFTAEAAKHPTPDIYNHIAQTILLRQMLRSGQLESDLVAGSSFLKMPKLNLTPEDQARFLDAVRRAMDLAQASIAANPADTAALYALGVNFGLRANYDFMVRKAWLDTLHDVTSARKLHNKVTEIDPEFIDAKLIQGLHDYVIGSLPFTWKLLGAVAGFHGDRARGIRTLKLVAEHGNADRIDATTILVAIYRREKHPENAIPLLKDLIARIPRNYLFRLELAAMYCDLGDKSKMLTAMDDLDQLKRAHAPGYEKLPEEKLRDVRERLLARMHAVKSDRQTSMPSEPVASSQP